MSFRQQFGCDVVGIDYGQANVALATQRAQEAAVAAKVRFEQGDAEQLPFDEAAFDVIICECAFCIFPNKARAAQEFARVLRPGGKIGLSDLTRAGPLSPSLGGLLAWAACIADARPAQEYQALLETAGFTVAQIEAHPEALRELIREIQGKLLGVELLARLNKLSLPDLDFERAKTLIQAASGAVRTGRLSYTLIAGAKR